MAKSSYYANSSSHSRSRLEKCWLKEIDIDPLIIRIRKLYQQGNFEMAKSMEEEVVLLF